MPDSHNPDALGRAMIRVVSRSEAGGHSVNQDAFEVRRHPGNPHYLLCAIADGQGGRAGVREAATLATRAALDAAAVVTPDKLFRAGTWRALLGGADACVARDPAAGFTTLAVFCLDADRVCGASSGDSAVLVLAAAGSPVIVTDRQRKNPPVGSGGAVFVPFRANLAPPWAVLAMTDGVWKYAGWNDILNIAPGRQGEEIIDALLGRARLQRTQELQDDFTLIVLQSPSP